MATLKLTVVSPERELYSGDVDVVLAPSVYGQLGIFPHHSPLIAQLEEGSLCARVGEEEYYFAIHGGFIHVLPDQVTVLADTAERAEEIDLQRAEEARKRALETLRKALAEKGEGMETLVHLAGDSSTLLCTGATARRCSRRYPG